MVGQLHQEREYVVRARITSFVEFSEARIMVVLFHVGQANVGVSVVVSLSVVAVDSVAPEPFVESHGAHDVVVRHRVETVKGAFHFLLGADTGLEAGGGSCGRVAVPFHNVILLKAPGFVNQGVHIFRLDKAVLQLQLVEIKHLSG